MTVIAALGAVLVVLVVPGVLPALALRVPPLLTAALTPSISLALTAFTAELARSTHVAWSPWWPLLSGIGIGGVALFGRRIVTARARTAAMRAETSAASDSGHEQDPSWWRAWAPWIGVAIGGTCIAVQQMAIMGSLHRISQTYDAVFHLNAIRHVLRLEDGSAFAVGGMTSLPGQETFYPASWHQAASLVVMIGQQDLILSSNALMIVVGAVVWPLTIASLVRYGTSTGPVGWMLGGALAGVSASFPLALMSWGLLSPFFLAVAQVPLLLLMVVHTLRLHPQNAEHLKLWQIALITSALLISITAAHPQAIFVSFVLAIPVAWWAVLVRGREFFQRRAGAFAAVALYTLAALVLSAAGLVLWIKFSPSFAAAVWEGTTPWLSSIAQALSLVTNGVPALISTAVVLVLCVVAYLRKGRDWWLLPPLLVALVLNVVSRSLPVGKIRYAMLGGWYGDPYRAQVIVVIVAIPVLAIGLERLINSVGPRMRLHHYGARGVVAAVLAVVLTGSLWLTPSGTRTAEVLMVNWRRDSLLTDDELALLEMLPEYVEPGEVIATNAWNGSSLAYAISDRDVLNTFMGFSAEDEVHLVNARLDELHNEPEVCDAAHELNIKYALDFGPEELLNNYATYTGLNQISYSGAAIEVARVGEASLWELLPCEGTDGSMRE